MTATVAPVLYTETELCSYLPSGWRIAPGGAGRWDAKRARWCAEVRDGADNAWTIEVAAAAASGAQRLEALRAAIDRVQRKGLGRKSILLG